MHPSPNAETRGPSFPSRLVSISCAFPNRLRQFLSIHEKFPDMYGQPCPYTPTFPQIICAINSGFAMPGPCTFAIDLLWNETEFLFKEHS
jgi:hypothetical protein